MAQVSPSYPRWLKQLNVDNSDVLTLHNQRVAQRHFENKEFKEDCKRNEQNEKQMIQEEVVLIVKEVNDIFDMIFGEETDKANPKKELFDKKLKKVADSGIDLALALAFGSICSVFIFTSFGFIEWAELWITIATTLGILVGAVFFGMTLFGPVFVCYIVQHLFDDASGCVYRLRQYAVALCGTDDGSALPPESIV
jgi:uncharacterized membrane protein YcjF (UPF0283 family)